jgi:hypothetical protein
MVCAISGSAQWIGIEGSAGTLIQVGVQPDTLALPMGNYGLWR